MKLTPGQRDDVADMMAEAHRLATRPDGSMASRSVPVHFHRLLREAEPAQPWVGAYLDDLALKGAGRVAADWRRSHRSEARTAAGTNVEVGSFAGTTRRGEDGTNEYVQLRLVDMTLEDLRAHLARLKATRNTLSRDVRLCTDLIERMETAGYTSAAPALADLKRAS